MFTLALPVTWQQLCSDPVSIISPRQLKTHAKWP